MAGREELYLKHIDENTGKIAKVLEKVLAKTRRVKYVDQYSPERVRGILEDFAAYYAGYAITDDQNAKADEIFEAIDKYMEYMDLREATK